ncbi:hypothetical protein P692DRAFT_20824660, partial [Suillus brevipes Sb2]
MADFTPRPAPKMTGARQLPPGFFDDALREANLRIRLSQSHAPPTPIPHQRTLSSFTSVWRRAKPPGATEPATQSRSRPFSLTQNLSGILHRRDRSNIQMREVEVPCTAGKPRNNLAEQRNAQHHHYGYHLQLLPPRHPPLSLVLLGQQEQYRLLISLVLDGALLSWPGFAACQFRTQTVTI